MQIRHARTDVTLATWLWRTFRFSVVVGLGFTLLNFALSSEHESWSTLHGWLRAMGTSTLFAAMIGGTIDLLFTIGHRLIGDRIKAMPTWQRLIYWWGTPLIGLAIAIPIASMITGIETRTHPGPYDSAASASPELRTTPLGAAAFMLLIIAIFYGFFAIRERQRRAERQATEAQLKLLQAQMEPHFLFNTLANVIGLMEVDTPRAKLMLESFTDYLRASLGSMRHADHTLGDELDLIDAYLRVVKIRMDDRLRYQVDVPAELRGLQIPALSLQPLVENAVVHGLEPKIEGGTVTIAAELDANGVLMLRVTDDGLGLPVAGTSKTRGTGTALANIRERLLQAPCAGGGLQIEARQPHGVLATLTIPKPDRRSQ